MPTFISRVRRFIGNTLLVVLAFSPWPRDVEKSTRLAWRIRKHISGDLPDKAKTQLVGDEQGCWL